MPLSLFIFGARRSTTTMIWNASLIFRSLLSFAWSITLNSDQLIWCGSIWSWTCSAIADFEVCPNRIASLCSLHQTSIARRVSPTYSSSHVLHRIKYCVKAVELGNMVQMSETQPGSLKTNLYSYSAAYCRHELQSQKKVLLFRYKKGKENPNKRPQRMMGNMLCY